MLIERSGKIGGADDVIGDDVLQEVEPEKRKLRKDAAFIWNGSREDDVEGGKAVGSDDEKFAAEVEDVANFATRRWCEAGEMSFAKNGSYGSCRHEKIFPQERNRILAHGNGKSKASCEENWRRKKKGDRGTVLKNSARGDEEKK